MKAPVLCIISLAALLSGCVNLKPKADHTQIFTLAADVPVATNLEGQPMVYVTRVEIPGFLEDTRILYRLANGELESFAGARWTDALDEALPRAIAMHLQSTSRANVRAYYPWSNTTREVAKVAVQFERFSANAAGQVEVVAQWQIELPDGQTKQGRYIATGLQWDGSKVASYVAQLNSGLAGLAETIAREL